MSAPTLNQETPTENYQIEKCPKCGEILPAYPLGHYHNSPGGWELQNPPAPTQSDWEKEFDKKFVLASEASGHQYLRSKNGAVSAYEQAQLVPKLKTFIRETLATSQQETLERVKEAREEGVQAGWETAIMRIHSQPKEQRSYYVDELANHLPNT